MINKINYIYLIDFVEHFILFWRFKCTEKPLNLRYQRLD